MAKYVLNYFPLQARGEPARLLFHLAGVEFTDNMVPMADWPTLKGCEEKFPLGHMPTLEVDGVVITESAAVYSYIANEFGLYGSTSMDKATIDMVRGVSTELFDSFIKLLMNSSMDGEEKAKAITDFFANPNNKKLLGFLTKHAKSSKGKFFIGDSPTVADVLFFNHYAYFSVGYPDIVKEYPELAAIKEAVGEVENIKKYVATRKSLLK